MREHSLSDCLVPLARAYEKQLDAEPGSAFWQSTETAVNLKTGKERTVLCLWLSYQKKGKKKVSKSYFIARFCPFCGKPLSENR